MSAMISTTFSIPTERRIIPGDTPASASCPLITTLDPYGICVGSTAIVRFVVAEDCGGAIKHNCIDIYVATHQEGEDKGVYYTDVYLLK